VAPDGSLYLFDRSGTVLHATELGPTAEPQLHAAAVAHIGGGRTLGAHFDRDGNLIFCHPPVVRPPLVDCSRHAPTLNMQEVLTRRVPWAYGFCLLAVRKGMRQK
jgi:hypothetical protein